MMILSNKNRKTKRILTAEVDEVELFFLWNRVESCGVASVVFLRCLFKYIQ